MFGTPGKPSLSGTPGSSSSAISHTPPVTPCHSSDTPDSRVLTPSNYVNMTIPVTPEDVMPYPKAPERKKSNRGKQPGKTMIPTSTPEKMALRAIHEEKENKIAAKAERAKERALKKKEKEAQMQGKISKKTASVKKKLSKSLDEPKAAKKKQNRRKIPVLESSSSNSDDEPVPVVDTSDDEDDEECLYCRNSKVADRSGEKWCKCIQCGRWVHYLCADVSGSEWKTYVCDLCA